MKSIYLNDHTINVNYVDNVGMNKKVMNLIIKDNAEDIVYILPIAENNLKFFESIVGIFKAWVEKNKRPNMALKPMPTEEPTYIG